MADVTLKAVLLGEDRSMSKSMNKAGQAVEGVGKKSSVMGGVLKGVLAAGVIENAASAVVDFGRDSIAAFQGAEKSQRALSDAYQRFPRLADVNIGKLRELATAIERKNGADADDIASGQAVLARYQLTGKQLQKMTPLLVDYAARTGKDIPTAAAALGKALTGSTRLSKELGFSFDGGKNKAKNLQQVMAGLRKTVGGYADKEATTAAGKSKILATRFGNLQESVGEKLTPALEKLLDRGNKVTAWLEDNPEAVDGMANSIDGMADSVENGASMIGDVFTAALTLANRAVDATASGLADMLDIAGLIPGEFGDKAKAGAAKLRGIAIEARKTASNLGMIGKQKIIVNTTTGVKSVRQLKKEIDRIKGKIVTARAKGDGREVDRLQRKLAAVRSRTVTITANVRIIGRTVRIGAVAGARLGVLRAMGGPVAAGAPYWVGEHGPELFLPGSSGHIKNPFQIANKLSGSTTSSSSVTNNYFTINTPAGAPLAFAKAVETELVKLRQSRGGAGTLKF